jgi:type II secretory pathway predicted ATPase ExeA
VRLKLKAVLAGLGKSQGDLGRAIGYSAAAVSQIVNHGFWPRSVPRQEVQERIRRALREWVADEAVLDSIFDEWPEPRGNAAQADPQPEAKEDDQMLLQHETLTHEARAHFGLPRSPFVDDINSLDDVFVSASTRRARAALLDCALNQGFMALIGESGSGKSTLREELEERIQREHRPVVVITPYVAEAERGDRLGVYKPRQIAEAIVHTLAPGDSVRQSAQARTRQVHQLLKSSASAGMNNLLIIEEAHRLPKVTVRSLKSYMELKDGLRRLLGICLIGQTELDHLLSATAPDVREIVQRCERRQMLPLDDDLPAYLAHKFGRVGVSPDQVFADGAHDAIRARLVRVPRNGTAADAYSICYPLVVNNLVTRAMNAAAAVAMPRVTPDVIGGC